MPGLNNTTSINLAASGSGDIAAFTATNIGTTPVIATITVTPNYCFYSNHTHTTSCNNGHQTSFTITVNPSPTITLAATTSPAVCSSASSQSSQITYSTTTNSPDHYTITWDATAHSANLVDVASTALPGSPITVPIAANVAGGIYNGNLKVTNAYTCVSPGTGFTATVYANPTVTITPASPATCAGTWIMLTANQTGGSGSYKNPTWSGPDASSLNSTTIVNPSFSNASSGNYHLTFTVTDLNNCQNNASTIVTVSPAAVGGVLSPASPTICSGSNQTLTLTPLSYTGTIAHWETSTDNWTTTTIINNTTNTLTATNVTTAAKYRVLIQNGSCSSAYSSEVLISLYPAFTASASSNSPICQNSAIILSSQPSSMSYLWSGPLGFTSISQNPTISSATAAMSGTYTVQITDSHLCQSSVSTNVTVNSLPSISITTPSQVLTNILKKDTTVHLSGNQPGAIFTGDGVITSQNIFNPNFVDIPTGNSVKSPLYYTYTDANHCTSTVVDTFFVQKAAALFNNLKTVYCKGSPQATFSVTTTQTLYYGNFYIRPSSYPSYYWYWNYISNYADYNASNYGYNSGIIDPSIYSTGNYIVHYDFYLDPYGYVEASIEQQITIEDAGTPSIIGLNASYCDKDINSYPLNAINLGTGAKGYWTGPNGDKLANSTTYVLKPYLQSLTPGTTYTILFSDTSTNGCPSQPIDQTFIINSLPTVSILNDTVFNVAGKAESLRGNNSGGIFTGLGVTEITKNVLYTFSPSSAGTNPNVPIFYSYTDPITGCSNNTSKSFNIKAASGSISNNKADPSNTSYCSYDNAHFTFTPPFTLHDSVYFQLDNDITTIQYGITDYSFAVNSLSSGTPHLARFFYKDGHSWFEKNQTFTIVSATAGTINATYPTINGKSKSYACQNSNNIVLAISGYSPSGGTGNWIGTVVNQSNLQAEVPATDTGKIMIQYQYTSPSPSNCPSSVINKTILVLPLPVDSITSDSIYNVAGNKNNVLSGSTNILIAKRTFSGTGVVNGSSFDPSNAGVGATTIHYTYTDTSGCIGSSSRNFEVLQANDTLTFTKNSCYSQNMQPIAIKVSEANKSYTKTSVTFSTAHNYDNISKTNNDNAVLTFTGNHFVNGTKLDSIIYNYKIGNAAFTVKSSYSIDSVKAAIDLPTNDHFCANGGVLTNLIANNLLPSGATGKWSDNLNLITPNGNFATFDPSRIKTNFNNNDLTDTITFNYTSLGGCASKPYSIKLYVHPKDTLIFGSNIIQGHNYNQTTALVPIQPNPDGGTFSSKTLVLNGDNMVPKKSSPGPGDINYTYNYQLNGFNCAASKTTTINIIAAAVSFHIPTAIKDTILCYWENIVPFTVTLNNDSIPLQDSISGRGVTQTGKGTGTINLSIAGAGNDTITYEYLHSDGYTKFSVPKILYTDSIDGGLSLSFDVKTKSYCAVANDSNIINANVHTPGKGIFYIQNDSLANHHIRTTSNYLAAYFHAFDLINNDYGKHSFGDDIKVNYLFTSNYGCTKLVTDSFVIHEQPHPQFTVPNICFDKNAGILFQNITQLNHDTVTSWNWNFGEATNNTTLEAQKSPIFQYSSSGPKSVTLTASTKYCSNDTIGSISIGVKPVSNFNWDDECFSKDGATSKKIAFNNYSQDPSTGNDPIQKYYWNISGHVDLLTSKSYSFNFSKPDDYIISLSVKTKNNCTDTLTKIIHIRPWINVNDESFYTENFLNGNGGWFGNLDSTKIRNILSDNSIWKLGSNTRFTPPTGETNVWYTQVDQSLLGKFDTVWVTSPCMDFMGIKKPMIELKIKKAFLQDIDGGVLQYTLDSSTVNPTWENIGTINEGINWYSSSSIQGQPGGQLYGWSGKGANASSFDSTWVDVRHNLDVIKGKPFVRLRLAYGYKVTGNKNEGFGFTDISIRNRDKVVLLEDFTNNSVVDNIDNYISQYNQYDILDIRYHSSGDDFYNQYASGPNAKALYYQIPISPYSLADGGNSNSAWENSDTVSKRTLLTPKFAINLKTTKTTSGVDVNTTITALDNVNASSITLNIAVVESSARLTGSTITYKNVVRKLLPDPSGTTYNQWNIGAPLSTDYSWQYSSDIDPMQIKIIAFIQNSQSKEIYQVATDNSAFNATAAPELINSPNEFSIYPNPAKDEVYVSFNQPTQYKSTLQIFNNVGMLISNLNISKQTRVININTSGLKNGMYFIRMSGERFSKTGKLIVSH